jgi:Cofilin/tropomyosin-type actin-binding protein
MGFALLTFELARSPDAATIREKMVFASSTEALRRALGVASVIQATDESEVEYETSEYPVLSSVDCTNHFVRYSPRESQKDVECSALTLQVRINAQ